MTVSVTEMCPDCGTPLPTETTFGSLCPRCLLELAQTDSPTEAATLDLPPAVLSPGAVLGGRYQIRSLLGRGGMGEVWRALDLKLRVDVALKALRPLLLEDERGAATLRQEVRSAREVAAPNVCRIFDLVELDGQELVSMEYIDGITLLDILKMRAPLDLSEAREIASQFLAGLEAIHEAGLVHRDVKPENLMMTRSGRVVLMDFGIAKGLAEGIAGTVSGTPAYMAPEQSRGEALDARADVFSAGVVLAEMIDPGGLRTFEARQEIWQGIHHEPPEITDSPWAPVLKKALARQKEQRHGSAATLARALEEVTLRVAGAEGVKPYPGLASFTENDAEYFFGRELEVEEMWKKLRRPHLLGLIGPSGAGKSSFLRAGLIPVMPTGWRAVITTPGNRPFTRMGQTLVEEFSGDSEAIRDLLGFEELDVAVDLVSRWRKLHDQVLIVIDQFEELFTQNTQEVQHRFAELLGRLALESDARVLISMRDDFLFYCSGQAALSPLFSELTPLRPPSGTALRRAVVQPALKCGYRFEDESLVEEMVGEVTDERGALPMLAFAASRLWDTRDRERGLLTREAYEHIGGVGGALAQHAEATLEKIGQDRSPIVRELFRNLVTAQGTRAARDRDELLSVFDEQEPAPVPADSPGPKPQAPGRRSAAMAVLDTLIDARLLTSYEVPAAEDDVTAHHRIEIIHESLLTAWPRLVRWQTQDTEGAQLRDELRQAAQTWEEHDRSADRLWTGTAFKEYEIWRERYPGSVSGTEEAFAQAMTGHAERRKRRRRTAVTAVVLLALVVATVMGGLWLRSEAQARRAEAAKLVALAQLRLEEDPTEALAYTSASLDLADTVEARVLAVRALWAGPPALEADLGGLGGWNQWFSPDGSRLAAAGSSEVVRVWSAEGGPPLVLPKHELRGSVAPLAEWFSNELLVTGLGGGEAREVRFWKFPGVDLVRTIGFGGPAFWGLGRDNHLLAEVIETEAETGHELYHLRTWRLPDGEAEELGTVDVAALGGSFSWFNSDASGWFFGRANEIYLRPLPIREGVPDGLVGRHDNDAWLNRRPDQLDRIWTRDAVTSELRLWDLAASTPEPLQVMGRPAGLEEGAAFSPPDPSGRWISSVVQQARLWDLEAWSEARPVTLRRSGSWFAARSAFHPRGDLLVVGTHGRSRLTFWPLRGILPSVVDGYSFDYFRPLEFSRDGLWLATIWPDNSLRLWPLPGSGNRQVKRLPLPPDRIWHDLVFDPLGRFVILVAFWDSNSVWAYVVPVDGSPARSLEGPTQGTMLSGAAVSPSGRQAAMAFRVAGRGTGDKTLRVWDLKTGEVRVFDLPESLTPEEGWEKGVYDLAFADESTLYTSGDGGLRKWNLDTGAHTLVLPTQHGSYYMSAAFGPSAQTAFVTEPMPGDDSLGAARVVDLAKGEVREIFSFAKSALRSPELWPRDAFDSTGTIAATGDREGIVRVARLSGGEPHLLLGHEGTVTDLAISPDGRWIASAGEDDTLRLWPMPDLDKPPLHTLPLDELLAKLESLTNLRAVRDAESSTGWSIEVGPFPGWEEVPEW